MGDVLFGLAVALIPFGGFALLAAADRICEWSLERTDRRLAAQLVAETEAHLADEARIRQCSIWRDEISEVPT